MCTETHWNPRVDAFLIGSLVLPVRLAEAEAAAQGLERKSVRGAMKTWICWVSSLKGRFNVFPTFSNIFCWRFSFGDFKADTFLQPGYGCTQCCLDPCSDNVWIFCDFSEHMRMIAYPAPQKCILRGGGRAFFIHFHSPPSEIAFIVWFFFW